MGQSKVDFRFWLLWQAAAAEAAVPPVQSLEPQPAQQAAPQLQTVRSCRPTLLIEHIEEMVSNPVLWDTHNIRCHVCTVFPPQQEGCVCRWAVLLEQLMLDSSKCLRTRQLELLPSSLEAWERNNCSPPPAQLVATACSRQVRRVPVSQSAARGRQSVGSKPIGCCHSWLEREGALNLPPDWPLRFHERFFRLGMRLGNLDCFAAKASRKGDCAIHRRNRCR